MSVLNRLSRIWRNIFHRERVDDDLNAELNSYLDLAADQYSARGMGRPEALRAAKLDAGGMEPVKEAVRDVRAGSLVESILRDLRFGGRLLARSPGFTAAALLMLAVGIGANTAVFSLLNALVLRGLPYSEPERIVRVFENRPREGTRHSASAPDYLDWRDQSTSFQSLAAMSGTGVTWQSESGAERVPAALVTPEFLDVYGVKPAVGTGFGADVQTRPSAILTHGFWQRRFGGDPAIIGKSLTIENTPIEIAGVLPSGFEYPEDDVELLLPLTWRSREQLDRASHEYTVTGRLKPGISLRAAQAELNTIAGRLESQYTVNKGHGAIAVPLADVLLEPVRRPLLILQFAAALVLLVACGNLANLLLARLLARERELSIRLAIGAGRGHLLRQPSAGTDRGSAGSGCRVRGSSAPSVAGAGRCPLSRNRQNRRRWRCARGWAAAFARLRSLVRIGSSVARRWLRVERGHCWRASTPAARRLTDCLSSCLLRTPAHRNRAVPAESCGTADSRSGLPGSAGSDHACGAS
jgi:hypothetical protein